MNISFRLRVTLWYTLFVGITLLSFAFLNYGAVSQELQQNLDSSILRVAESLEIIITKKQKETQLPLRPSSTERRRSKQKDTVETPPDRFAFFRQLDWKNFVGPLQPSFFSKDSLEKGEDEVWAAVYEHILLDPKNYFVQIADSTNVIVWRSENLLPDSLPFPQLTDTFMEEVKSDDSLAQTMFMEYQYDTQKLRILLYQSSAVQISVGYPVNEVEATLQDLFFSLLIALPGVLLISVLGGWILGKYFLQPVKNLANASKDITANNLSRRLPVREVNDEIGELTQTLNDMISRLESSFQQIRQFTGDASHELRTPLAVLLGELEIALRSNKTMREHEQTISSAIEEVVRMNKVVKNLLELSRADSGQMQLDVERLDLSRMLVDISEDLEILGEEKGLTTKTSIEPSLFVRGDKVRLYQSFLNVIENAIKYNKHGGTITVSLKNVHDELLVTISDTGIGIPRENLHKIFHRFYREDKARSQKVQGHGLGLSIMQTIIRTHGGTIGVESELGKGTDFFIRLPKAQ